MPVPGAQRPRRRGGQRAGPPPGGRPRRRSGQAAYFDRHLPSELGAGTPIGDAMAWALDHLAEPFDVDEFAKHSSMSRRTFDRRFLEVTGTTRCAG
ncbi:hypothetical protein ACFQ9X_14305 [Catenulispora yoronensis]